MYAEKLYTVQVYALGTDMDRCHTLCTRRRLTHLVEDKQEATINVVLGWIADRDLGDDVLEALATMNANNV